MTVPQVPPGSYPYYCLPHRAYDMRGALRIK
jgi:plastocyanin